MHSESPPVYLDYNATAPVRPAVRAAMLEALEAAGNPSSIHAAGRAARKRVEEARAAVAALVGAEPAGVIFTSGGTEANALARHQVRDSGRVLLSAIEHESLRATLNPAAGDALVPVTPAGVLDLTALEQYLLAGPPVALVAVMLANNETGVLQPLAEIVALARRFGARVHCDAVQAAGRVPFSLMALGVDSLTLSAHKLGGPQGVGALVRATEPGLPSSCVPLWRGGGQEHRQRPGTENVAGITGFGVAAKLALAAMADYTHTACTTHSAQAHSAQAHSAQHAVWCDSAVRHIQAIAPAAIVYGAVTPRLAQTLCIGMPGVPASTQVMAFDLAGVAVSAGAACSSGTVQPSPVLRAMGVCETAAGEAIRASGGWATTEADWQRFAEVWCDLYRRRHRPQPAEAA